MKGTGSGDGSSVEGCLDNGALLGPIRYSTPPLSNVVVRQNELAQKRGTVPRRQYTLLAFCRLAGVSSIPGDDQ